MRNCFLIVLLTFPAILFAQNPGFETGDLTGWVDDNAGTESVQSTVVRTGSYAANYNTSNATTNQRFRSTNYSVSVPVNEYAHVIFYANPSGSNNFVSGGVNFNGSSNAGGTNTTLTANTWTRVTHTRLNATGSTATAYPYAQARLASSGTAIDFRYDDFVIYTSSSSTIDLTAPSSVSGVASSPGNNSITIDWANPSDYGTAGTGGVLILRKTGSAPTGAPNQNAQYFVGNIIGDASVVGIVPSGTSFTDNVSQGTTYYYALFAYDGAYNYSSGVGTNGDQALPVELSSFELSDLDGKIFLSWRTASETNNAGFEIYRSSKNSSFEKISSFVSNNGLVGLGNSSFGKNYSYTDNDVRLEPGETYLYKLVDVDLSGKRTEHPAKEIILGKPAEEISLTVYPNPASEKIILSNAHENILSVKIIDITGREIIASNPVNNFSEIDISALPSGSYTILTLVSKGMTVKKLQVVR